LIADDSSFLREQLRNFLEQTSSWQVFEAANGLEAVQKTQRVHPDVIILDYCMPVMNGLAAARELRRATPDTPVLFFSMDASSWLRGEARLAGAWARSRNRTGSNCGTFSRTFSTAATQLRTDSDPQHEPGWMSFLVTLTVVMSCEFVPALEESPPAGPAARDEPSTQRCQHSFSRYDAG